MKYFSQYRQDELADLILNKDKGVFLDIGANDGISYSNSYFFEKDRQWKGICIEPIPDTYKKLTSIRKCICLNCGVWSEEKVLKFYRAHGAAEMLSGIVDSFNDQHFQRMKNEIEASGGSMETLDIHVYSLNKILNDNNITTIDFCSIDTEGSEYEILRSIDFNRYTFHLLSIENQFDIEKTRTMMDEKGFRFIYRLGGDDFFVNKKSEKDLNIKSKIFRFKLRNKLKRIKKMVFK